MAVHDACLDLPANDAYTCQDQVQFGQCWADFMLPSVQSDWRGGRCELSCRRCSCGAGTWTADGEYEHRCAQVSLVHLHMYLRLPAALKFLV